MNAIIAPCSLRYLRPGSENNINNNNNNNNDNNNNNKSVSSLPTIFRNV